MVVVPARWRPVGYVITPAIGITSVIGPNEVADGPFGRGQESEDACRPARHSGASTDQISMSCRFPRYG